MISFFFLNCIERLIWFIQSLSIYFNSTPVPETTQVSSFLGCLYKMQLTNRCSSQTMADPSNSGVVGRLACESNFWLKWWFIATKDTCTPSNAFHPSAHYKQFVATYKRLLSYVHTCWNWMTWSLIEVEWNSLITLLYRNENSSPTLMLCLIEVDCNSAFHRLY